MRFKDIISLFRQAREYKDWSDMAFLRIYDDGSGAISTEDTDDEFPEDIVSFEDEEDLVKKLSSFIKKEKVMAELEAATPGTNTGTECLKVTYQRVSLCFWAGYPVTYTAGEGDIVLTGNIPANNSWDGKYFKLYGHLVQNNNCTMLFVEKAVPCNSPDVG